MENDFRLELVRSNRSLNRSESELPKALEREGHDFLNAYVLNWTPEQDENIYLVLIEGSYLICVKIDKFSSSKQHVFERIEIKDYLHGLSKMNQIQLAVARDLAGVKENKAELKYQG